MVQSKKTPRLNHAESHVLFVLLSFAPCSYRVSLTVVWTLASGDEPQLDVVGITFAGVPRTGKASGNDDLLHEEG